MRSSPARIRAHSRPPGTRTLDRPVGSLHLVGEEVADGLVHPGRRGVRPDRRPPAAPGPGDHRAERAHRHPQQPDLLGRHALGLDPVPAAQHVEVLLAAGGEPHVIALGVAVVAQVHHEDREPGLVEHPGGQQDASPRGDRTGRRGPRRRPGRPPAPGGSTTRRAPRPGSGDRATRNWISCGSGIAYSAASAASTPARHPERRRACSAWSSGWHSPVAVPIPSYTKNDAAAYARSRRMATTASPVSTHFLRDERASLAPMTDPPSMLPRRDS